MAEMAHAGEHHGNAVLIGSGNHFFITHGAARVDNRLNALLGNHINAVAEGEEGVGRGAGTV